MNNSITQNQNISQAIPLEYCDYNDTQLLAVIEHLISGMRTVANSLDSSRPDVAVALDSIIDYNGIVELDEVKQCYDVAMPNDTHIIILDRIAHKFILTDLNGTVIEETPALTIEAALKKADRKAARKRNK
jgi:hypothetical protein